MLNVRHLFRKRVDVDATKAFPSALVEEFKGGADIPALYSGPLYTSNGAKDAQAELDAIYATTYEASAAASLGERVARIEQNLPEGAFAAPRHTPRGQSISPTKPPTSQGSKTARAEVKPGNTRATRNDK